MIYVNTKKINKFKKIGNDYYVIADFDHTLTTSKSTASMGIIPKYLGGEVLKQRLALYEHYRPLELDYSIEENEKQKIMKEWATKSFTLLSKSIKSNETVKNALKGANLCLKEGAEDFLKEMYEIDIPVIIMSAGVGNIIEEFLKEQNCLYKNIYIVSNFFEFSDEKAYLDIKNIIATSNKEYSRIPKEVQDKIKERKGSLLLGDLIEDLKMQKKENLERTLTIGFLDENIEEGLEKYNKNFDIVLTNNSNFNDIKNVLK